MSKKLNIAIAGATGFVGLEIIKKSNVISEQSKLVSLTEKMNWPGSSIG